MADGKVVIDVILDDGSVAKGVADIGGKLGGIGDAGRRAGEGVMEIVSALGLVALARAGIDMLKASIDGAITRFDTLTQFPRVMEMIGFEAGDSEKAINRLSDGVQGLPTRLDSVASTAQNIAVMTGDLDGAVETTLALNNAFLASGSSSADAERGLQQYVQMLSKGEVDLQSWRTLQETMGVALNQLAEDFGFTGASAQNDLYDALQSGAITFDEFNTKLIEASNAQGGFADMALTASEGIRTSWENIKTAVVNGVAGVIGEIDKLLEDNGLGGIQGVLERVKDSIYTLFGWITANIPKVVGAFMSVYNTLKPWFPLIASIVTAVVGMMGAWALFNNKKAIIDGVKGGITALKTGVSGLFKLLLTNPWLLMVGAAILAITMIILHWDTIKEFFAGLWQSIQTLALAVWEPIQAAWDAVVSVLKTIWEPIKQFFQGLWDNIKSTTTQTWDAIKGVLEKAWDAIKSSVKTAIENVKTIVDATWNIIKTITQTAWDNIKTAIQTVWDVIKTVIQAAVDIIKTVIDTAWNVIKGIIETVMSLIKGDVDGAWNSIKGIIDTVMSGIKGIIETVWNAIKGVVSTVLGGIKTIVSTSWNGIKETVSIAVNAIKTVVSNIFNSLKGVVSTAFNGVKNAVSTGINGALKVVTNIAGKFKEAGRKIVTSIADGIKGAIGTVTGAISDVTAKIRSFLPFSPAKAGALRDIMNVQISESIAKAIDKGKGKATKSMSDLAEELQGEAETSLNLDARIGNSRFLDNIIPIKPISGKGSASYNNSKSYSPTINNYFTKEESTPSEVARKNKQQQRRLALEWGY